MLVEQLQRLVALLRAEVRHRQMRSLEVAAPGRWPHRDFEGFVTGARGPRRDPVQGPAGQAGREHSELHQATAVQVDVPRRTGPRPRRSGPTARRRRRWAGPRGARRGWRRRCPRRTRRSSPHSPGHGPPAGSSTGAARPSPTAGSRTTVRLPSLVPTRTPRPAPGRRPRCRREPSSSNQSRFLRPGRHLRHHQRPGHRRPRSGTAPSPCPRSRPARSRRRSVRAERLTTVEDPLGHRLWTAAR